MIVSLRFGQLSISSIEELEFHIFSVHVKLVYTRVERRKSCDFLWNVLSNAESLSLIHHQPLTHMSAVRVESTTSGTFSRATLRNAFWNGADDSCKTSAGICAHQGMMMSVLR